MLAIHTTPLRRVQWAGLGYLFLYLASQWRPNGFLGSLVLAVCAAALAVQLLRIMAAGMRRSAKTVPHPVQSGKPGLKNRNRAPSEQFRRSPSSHSQAVGLGS